MKITGVEFDNKQTPGGKRFTDLHEALYAATPDVINLTRFNDSHSHEEVLQAVDRALERVKDDSGN